MNKFISRITPDFIKDINSYLLKNNPLGWQLQLPQILWLWFLITVVTLPVPIFFPLETDNSSDINSVVIICFALIVMQLILFSYLLIQFNRTKVSGNQTRFGGLREQWGYLLVMFLPFTGMIFFQTILDFRKAAYMTPEQITREAKIYNIARHFFTDNFTSFKYFPDDSSFVSYLNFRQHEAYQDNPDTIIPGEYRERDEYYEAKIKPFLNPYFDERTAMLKPEFTRKMKGPSLYFIGENYLTEKYSYWTLDRPFHFGGYMNESDSIFYRYQLAKYSDDGALKLIRNFIELYIKYHKEGFRNRNFWFDPAEVILRNYKSNQLVSSVHFPENQDNIDYFLKMESIENTHRTVMHARFFKWIDTAERALVCFFIALGLSVLMFIFKNVRLKEFILSFVYSGLLAILVTIVSVLSYTKEFLPVHVLILFFVTGLFYVLTVNTQKTFSHFRTYLSILANAGFILAPVFICWYLTQYLDLWGLPYEYCQQHQSICDERNVVINLAFLLSIGGGIVLYLTAGCYIFKKYYEKMLSLPLNK